EQLGPDERADRADVRAALGELARGLVAGARWLVARRTPAQALGIMALHRFCYGAVFIASILISRNLLSDPADVDAGLRTFASVLVASGVGFALAVVLTPVLSPRTGPHRWIVLCLGLAVVSQLLLAVTVERWAVLAGGLALGLAAQGAKIAVDTIVQRDTVDAYRGRAFSLYDVLYNAAFVGAAALAAVTLPDTGWSRPVFVALAVVYALGAAVYAAAPHEPADVPGPARQAAAT
ncbi:MFS transporter, partial [Cellulomonas sp. 179-A 9B4 NHS]|uniref:MFS transporter n=1 Tax=Cellulomonas sp. 179-A 9B4 NHS TaxID=3142379 RepID=UPI0039A1E641